jgi:hypothetical protein
VFVTLSEQWWGCRQVAVMLVRTVSSRYVLPFWTASRARLVTPYLQQSFHRRNYTACVLDANSLLGIRLCEQLLDSGHVVKAVVGRCTG